MNPRLSLVLILAAAPVLSSCRHVPDGPMAVHLVWMPTDSEGEVSPAALAPFVDQRWAVTLTRGEAKPRSEIGRNTENLPPLAVTTQDDIDLFVATHVTKVLASNGAKIVETGADRALTVEPVRVFVEEHNIYRAEVVIRFGVQDAQGKVLWKGIVQGTDRAWGHSFESEKYVVTISNGIIDAVHQLIETPDFIAAAGGVQPRRTLPGTETTSL